MTETQHPSELESAMDNLEALMEAVSVARQKVRDRQRRAVPNRAPRRPSGEPIDGVVDEEAPRDDQEDSTEDPAPEEDSAEIENEELDGAGPVGEESAVLDREERAEQAAEEAPASWAASEALPPASPEVRRYMAQMAVEGRHQDWVQRSLEEAGPGSEFLIDDPIARHRVFRAAAEQMVDAQGEVAGRSAAILERSGLEDLPVHDAEGKSLERELADVRRSELSSEQQAAQFAERIALVQEQQAAEQAEQARHEEEVRRGGSEFSSEIRLPLTLGAAGVAAAGAGGSAEAVERYVEELGARIEGDELIVPVSGEGSDLEASVDPAVSAWRSVTAEELVQAAVSGEETSNLSYLHTVAGQEITTGPAGEVPAPGTEPGQIRPTEDGLAVDAAIARDEVSPAVWEQLRGEFGDSEIEADVLFVPVSADPHADPAEAVGAARADLPASVFAGYEAYEQQLLARRELAAAAEDPGVWVQPAGEEAYVDMVEKQRADGSLEAVVWVDEHQQPTTHPEGVPSAWFDGDGTVTAFGHYDQGRPAGTWGWTDTESGTFVSDRAEMGERGPVSGTKQHRDSAEDGWTTVDDGPATGSSDVATGSTEPAEPGGAGLDAAPEPADPSPSPGPRRNPVTPPMPDPSGPSRGPRLR